MTTKVRTIGLIGVTVSVLVSVLVFMGTMVPRIAYSIPMSEEEVKSITSTLIIRYYGEMTQAGEQKLEKEYLIAESMVKLLRTPEVKEKIRTIISEAENRMEAMTTLIQYTMALHTKIELEVGTASGTMTPFMKTFLENIVKGLEERTK